MRVCWSPLRSSPTATSSCLTCARRTSTAARRTRSCRRWQRSTPPPCLLEVPGSRLSLCRFLLRGLHRRPHEGEPPLPPGRAVEGREHAPREALCARQPAE
jgi:hypothetical protein